MQPERECWTLGFSILCVVSAAAVKRMGLFPNWPDFGNMKARKREAASRILFDSVNALQNEKVEQDQWLGWAMDHIELNECDVNAADVKKGGLKPRKLDEGCNKTRTKMMATLNDDKRELLELRLF